MMRHSGRFFVLFSAVCLWLMVALPTWAMPMRSHYIMGQPLQIYDSNDGYFQVIYIDALKGQRRFASGGLHVWYGDCAVAPSVVTADAVEMTAWLPRAQNPIFGDGSAVNPWRSVSRLQAVCGFGLDAAVLNVETIAKYVDGNDFFHLATTICGGQPGELVSAALIADASQLKPEVEHPTAVLDVKGCADFNVLWRADAPPATPTALKLLSVKTHPAPDPLVLLSLTLLIAFFLSLLVLWHRSMRRPSP